MEKGYSRIPIYYGPEENGLIFGILLTKSLVGLKIPAEGEDSVTIIDLVSNGKLKMKEPLYCTSSIDIESVLDHFKKGYVHQAIVVEEPEKLVYDAE